MFSIYKFLKPNFTVLYMSDLHHYFPRLFFFLFQIEDMCHSTRASAVPVVPDSEGSVAPEAVICWVPVHFRITTVVK